MKNYCEQLIIYQKNQKISKLSNKSTQTIQTIQTTQTNEIDEIQDEFLYEFQQANIKRKMEFDTSNLTPETILNTFLTKVRPVLTGRDLTFVDALNS